MSDRDGLSRVRDVALIICVVLVILNLVTTLRIVGLTNDLNEAQARGHQHAVNDCETLKAVTQSLIDLNVNLITIDQRGDLTDKSLAAARVKAVADLKKIQPTTCGNE
jgi:type II secretory pathway component PulM